jgi:dolichyl-phosphate-mannose--protein O-mannosyl transferase
MIRRPAIGDLAPVLIAIAAMTLFLPRLAVAPTYMFDEVYHAYTAGQYAAGNADAYVWHTQPPVDGVAYMWNHPPAGILAITASILVWGDGPVGWRFASALFGAAGAALLYVFGVRMLRDRAAAALGAGLLLLDGLYFVQSRIGMLDMFGAVFALLALGCLHAYLTSPADRAGPRLACTGVAVGLALATKWNALWLGLLVGLVAVGRAFGVGLRARRDGQDAAARAAFRGHVAWIAIGLVAIPALTYIAAYVPFFAVGHGLDEWLELQNQIFRYHTGLEATHAYESSFWQWPLALRPVWYWVRNADDGAVARIYASHNPLLVWLYVPAVVWLAARAWRARDPLGIALGIGFFGQWLPWAFVPRIAFAYHFLPAVPWGALAVGSLVAWMWRRGRAWRALAVTYVAAVAGAFVFFYPIWAGVPLMDPTFALRMWLPTWR